MHVTISFFPWSCSRVLSLLEMPSTNYKDLNHAPMPEISLVGTEKTTFAAGRGSCSSGIARGGICTCSVRLHNSGSVGVGGRTAEADHLSCRGRLRREVVASRGLSNRPFQTQGQVEFGLTDPEAVVQAWGQLQAAKAQITAAQSQVASSEVALNGVREEARVGQRTTLDVLNAQQALVNARVALVVAQHDRVVASYNVLAAVGRLSPQVLGLATSVYDPMVHYQQVRDAWTGIRIPAGH